MSNRNNRNMTLGRTNIVNVYHYVIFRNNLAWYYYSTYSRSIHSIYSRIIFHCAMPTASSIMGKQQKEKEGTFPICGKEH